MTLPPYLTTTLATSAVGEQLIAAGVAPYLLTVHLSETSVRGWSAIGLLAHLRAHPEFQEGCLHGLHPDVGEDRTDFRGPTTA